MKKILFLSTGGTIASTTSENGLIPTVNGKDIINLIPELKNICQIDHRTLFSLDSSNIQPEDWVLMSRAVYEAFSDSRYDGIVITHGTDTMAYSASALSFMVQNLKKPVIFTGSQLPIEAPGTDGKRNILDAFLAACDERLAGVYIVFDRLLIHGCHAKKLCSRDFHAFESINVPPVGHITDQGVLLDEKAKAPDDSPMILNAVFDDSVFLLKLFPGTKPQILETIPGLGYKAVVIEAFGLGGIPNIRRNLLPAIHALIDKKIPVVVTTQCVNNGCDLTVYDVGALASKAGALDADSMTTESIIAKLMWILGQTDNFDQINLLFNRNFIGEFTKNQL